MKRLFLSILVLTLALGANAKNYLVSTAATTDGATITYKGADYVVGVDAFANLAALMNAKPEANSNVYVAPGTYSDAITINVNGLKFYGNNANCESRSKNRNTSAESIITARWTIAANNIVVNGFTLQGNGQMYEWNARNGKAISGFKFFYNIVTGSTVAKNAEYGVLQFGHYAAASEMQDTQWQNRYQNFEVKHNAFSGSAQNKANFVSISGAFGTTSIEDNTFTDGGTSIYLNNSNGTMNIKSNTFKNVGDTSRVAQGSTYGEFCISMRYCCKTASNIYIQNNVFTNCHGQGSMYSLIRFFNGDKSNTIMPLATSKIYMNYNIFTKKPLHSSRDYNYVYYSNDEYTGKELTMDCRFNEYDNSELCVGTVYLPDETTAGRVFGSSMGEFNFASSAGTTADYFASPCGTTIKSQTMKSTRVCQSFDIDETTDDMYFLQIDPNNGAAGYEPQTITRYYKKSDGTTGKQYMYLGNAAHGSNMAVCRINGTLYIFTGGNSETSKSTSRAICIFPFVSGATANLQKTSFTHSGKTYTIKQMTSGNGHTNQYPTIDKQNRLLCECSRSSNYMYFVIYDLDDAFTNLGNATILKSIKIQKLTNPFSSSSNPQYGDTDQGFMFWPFQGFTINGDYIYLAEGMGGGTNGLDGYVTVTYEGKNLPIVMLNAYNWRTNKWAYRKPVMKSAIINMSHGEPEGWKMRRGAKGRTNMYLQIANGAAGSRNNNVFEYVADIVTGYKYKVPTVTVTPSVTSLTYNTTSFDAVAQTVKLTNDYLLGGFYAVITGEDANDFLVQYATTNKHGKVWDTKTDVKVTFTPKEGKTSYKATLRIATPNGSDVVIPIQATYTPSTTPEPPTPTTPDSVHYELNGGELPKTAEVPTNDSLWANLRADYIEYYGHTRAGEGIADIANFLYGGAQHDSLNIKHLLTDTQAGWSWLGDYLVQVTSEQAVALETESNWRWNVHAFFNCFDGTIQGTQKATAANYTIAGKPDAWGSAYCEVYGTEVVLPETITETFILPTPVKEGYIFGGWYWEADFSGELVTQLEVGANGTLYAKWDIKNPTTTYLETLGANTAGVVKFFKDGRIVIWKDGRCYDIQGNIIR